VQVTSLDSLKTPNPTIAPYITGLNGVNVPQNELFTVILWTSLGAVAVVILLIRIAELAWAKLRQVSTMSVPQDKQGYWKLSQWGWMSWVKKHMTYAPLFRKRHNRELRISTAINVGTVPSRLQAAILFLYLAGNVTYMCILGWSQVNYYSLCAELRGRAGTLALANMVPLIVMAGRNNLLIGLLQISFDTYNLLHRWIGRIVVFEIVTHAIAWAIPGVANHGWTGAWKIVMETPFLRFGGFGMAALLLISIQSVSPIRHAFYETFLNMHIVLAGAMFACAWLHCITATLPGGLPQASWVIAIVSLWLADRLARVVRLVWANWSSEGFTEARCEQMPGDATRVTFHLPRYIDTKPGTHAYLRFWGVNAWESHPFSIAWVQQAVPATEKEPLSNLDRSNAYTLVSFLIGAQTGMTRKLFNKAKDSERGLRMAAALEGPYGGHHSLDSYGHAVLFAGSTGIAHQIPYIRHLLNGYNESAVATRRVSLVWFVREHISLEWVSSFMSRILRIPNHEEVLRVQIFVTRSQSLCQLSNYSWAAQMTLGRPNVPLLLAKEIHEQVGAMVVSVCGPGGLADDVRSAVRSRQGHTVIDFIEESFTW
jgi:predicted ferric reductase